jgi:hypothetical protein
MARIPLVIINGSLIVPDGLLTFLQEHHGHLTEWSATCSCGSTQTHMGLVNQVKMDEECAKLKSEIQKSIIRCKEGE